MHESPLVYLDHNATTPLDPRVFEAMRTAYLDDFGNAASHQHAAGRRAAELVEGARVELASLLGADPREIVWTSGATESDNLALKGVARAPAYRGKRHLVSVVTEHKAVLDPLESLEREGFEVTRLPVDGDGLVDLDRLTAALRDDTLLVSVMHANNEIGVLQPIEKIGPLCKQRGVLFHTDATQSLGKVPIDVEACQIDLLSCSAHKLHGPQGVGALYIRRRGPRVRCEPLLDGGGHQRGVRPGTLNVPGIVGLAAAVALCREAGTAEQERVRELRDRLEQDLLERIPDVSRNGHPTQRLASTANLSFAGTDAESLMRRMPGLAVSTSSACTSATLQPSYVLAALGASRERIDSSLRFSLGRFTTAEEIELSVEMVVAAVAAERAEGPLPACG
ncbi:MAG: cysteine desulfurase family protein [Planctomycetota bacterium]